MKRGFPPRLATAAVLWGVCAVLLASARPAPAIEGDYEAAVTRIPCKLTERLSSQDLKTGDHFGFDTTSSAEINAVFLPTGTHGHGIVVAVEAGRGQRPGNLVLDARTLDMPDGKRLAVGLESGQLDRRLARGGAVSGGAGALFVGNARETNLIYERGTAFVVTAPPPATPAPEPS